MFIKSNKWLILVATLCIMVTNNTNASDAIKQIDMNNIEHSSSVLASNLETVIEIHHDNEINHNNTNLEHSNNDSNNNVNHNEHDSEHNNNNNQINYNGNNLEHSNNEIHHNDSEHNNHDNINIERNENNHNNNANNNNVRNSSEQEQHDNNAVALNINEQEVNADDQKKESFCNSITATICSVVTLPVSICSYIFYGIVNSATSIVPESNIHKVTMDLRDTSKEAATISLDNSMTSLVKCITLSCGKVISVGTNTIGDIKSYIVRKILG